MSMKTCWLSNFSIAALALAPYAAFAGVPSIPAPPSFSAANSTPGVTNFDPAILPKARAAMAKVRAGAARMKIAFIGDSTSAGLGGGTGGANNATGGRNASFPTGVAKQLAAVGVPAVSDAFFADGAIGVLGDTRVTYGTGWSVGGPGTLGGGLISQSTTTATSYAVTPSAAWNECDVYYVNTDAGSAFTLDYSGAGTVAVTLTTGAALLKQAITPTLGNYTLNIKATSVSGGAIYIAGVDCFNTTAPQVSVWNWGISGNQSSNFIVTGNSWSTLTAIGYYAPDLTIIDIGINDETAAVSYATFYSNIQTIITKAKLSGDVILVMHHDASGHSTSELTTLNAMRALSVANNLPLVNFMYRLGSWTQANSLGEMFDSFHGNATGYADEARMLANLLLQL